MKSINDGYTAVGKNAGNYGKNANVHESRLNAGGDKAWKGKRTGTKAKKAMSYKKGSSY